MREIDWDVELNELCLQLNGYGGDSKDNEKKRKDLLKAFEAVKAVALKYPNLSKSAFRRKVYSYFFPGLWSFIAMALLSTVIRMVVEYLIEQLYPDDKEQNNGSISIPAKRLR